MERRCAKAFGVALGPLWASAALLACTPAETRVPPKLDPAAWRIEQQELELLTTPHAALATPEDAIVRVVGPQMTCTGTMIAPDLVLTAHHCVVLRGARLEFTTDLVRAERLEVQLGGDYLPWGHVGVKAVVAPPCGEAGGAGDVAILVLTRKIVGLTTVVPRLEGPPRRGEYAEPMGFGRCALSPEGIRRVPREGGTLDAVRPGTIALSASICPGDSGGPLLARGTHEVIGVVSMSAMDADAHTRSLSVAARLDTFRSVFVYARQIADGAEPADLPPPECPRSP